MKALPKRFTFRRVGIMTYDVVVGRDTVGMVWRSRFGWSASLPDGEKVVEDYGGSRDTAASVLRMAFDERRKEQGVSE